ncbi:MAG: HAMP domain-containing histidine kinase [Rhodocyclaceae bacterium]|nr:HAMP domain-containing histidine kinase [Rhodocyclaceae bacterium]
MQLAQRARSDDERAQSLAELQAGLLRASHVVAQLLTLARAEPGATEEKRATVSLAELVRQVVGDHAGVAGLKGIDLGATRLDERVSVAGDPAALRVMLANLVENAVLYCNAGARIDLSAGLDDGRPFVEVADNGPGIPEGERERVFDRFYRRQDTVEGGSGLGLAIVKAIALRHGGRTVVRETSGGGATVRVTFAMPAPGAELHSPD